MKNRREDNPAKPFSVTPPPDSLPGLRANPGHPPQPEGWRSLATGLRGTRLYRVTLPAGGGVYWAAAVMLNDKLAHRRCASELHARAWLSLATERRPSAIPFDLEEIHGRFRAACIIASSPFAPVRQAG